MRGWPSGRVLAVGALVLVGAVLIGAVARLALGHPEAAGQRIALAPGSPVATPATSPPDQPTPFAAAPTATPTDTPSPTPTPRTTPTSTPSSVPLAVPGQLQARRSARVTLTAQTAPHTTCAIAVGYSPPPQLAPASSSGSGSVSWTWRVGLQVQPGTYPIQVSCGGATATTSIVVS